MRSLKVPCDRTSADTQQTCDRPLIKIVPVGQNNNGTLTRAQRVQARERFDVLWLLDAVGRCHERLATLSPPATTKMHPGLVRHRTEEVCALITGAVPRTRAEQPRHRCRDDISRLRGAHHPRRQAHEIPGVPSVEISVEIAVRHSPHNRMMPPAPLGDDRQTSIFAHSPERTASEVGADTPGRVRLRPPTPACS